MNQAPIKVRALQPNPWTQPLAHLQQWKKRNSVLNHLGRVMRRGNYWYWVDAPDLAKGISISELVCPLRYDVYVRGEFFSFYREHRALYQRQPVEFMRRVHLTSYYIWYMGSEAVRCNPHLRGNAAALEQGFVDRIQRAIDLYERVMAEGFSTQFPLILKTAERLLPPTTDRNGPPTGKTVSAKYFLADGWHRLALMMKLGYQTLPAEFFRVKCFREFSPFDSTSLLVRALPLDEATYFRFLSTRYCAPLSLTQRDAFLNFIRAFKPEALEQVLSLVRVDGYETSMTQN